MSVVDLRRTALNSSRPRSGRMQHSDVEERTGAGRAMQIIHPTPLYLLVVVVQHRIVERFRRNRKTVRVLIHIGEIGDQLDIVHTQRMFHPMRFITVPALMERTFVLAHRAEPNLAKAQRPTHELFYNWKNARVAYQLVKLRRRQQSVIISALVMAV